MKGSNESLAMYQPCIDPRENVDLLVSLTSPECKSTELQVLTTIVQQPWWVCLQLDVHWGPFSVE